MPPPILPALLPDTVLLTISILPPANSAPPSRLDVELPENVLRWIVAVPTLYRPPPLLALLPLKRLSSTVSVPKSATPPPKPPLLLRIELLRIAVCAPAILLIAPPPIGALLFASTVSLRVSVPLV